MKKLIIKSSVTFVLSFLLLSSSRAELSQKPESFSDRVLSLPSVEEIFHQPKDDFDRSALTAGQGYFWLRYGKRPKISKQSFKGYVLNADPYHRAQKRISFLLGSDCSHFVHRIFQLLGANYSYTKTRNFIEWASRGHVSEWNECRNKEFSESFELLVEPTLEKLVPGDLIVWANARGSRGWYGHVVMVSGVSPYTILHAKNHRVGIVEEGFDEELLKGAKILRWVGPLASVETNSWNEKLQLMWARDPSRCAL